MEKKEIKKTPEERFEELIDKIAKAIVERRLGTIAIVMLESVKPLTFIGSQLMIFLDPFVTAFFKPDDYRLFSEMIEDRKNLEKLIERIEQYENEL